MEETKNKKVRKILSHVAEKGKEIKKKNYVGPQHCTYRGLGVSFSVEGGMILFKYSSLI